MKSMDVELNKRIHEKNWHDYEKMIYEPFSDVIVDIIKENIFTNVVEVGCGQGKNGYYIKEVNKMTEVKIDGTEISEEAKKWANKYYDHIDIREDCRLPDKKYDFVLLTSVIEHIYDSNLDTLFNDIQKKLTKNGKIFVVVPNIHSPVFLLTDSKESQLERMGHVNLKSKWGWNAFFRKYGFTHFKYSFSNRLPHINEMLFFKSSLLNWGLQYFYRLLNIFPFYYLKNSYWIEISR